jgi:prepilin-type N-terminal cleavage/methylation domain-containing protein
MVPQAKRHGEQPFRQSERGDTLVELLVAMVVISLVVAALFNGLMTTISGSVTHRSVVQLDDLSQSFVEHADYQLQNSDSSLFTTNCALLPGQYSDTNLSWQYPPAYATGYTVRVKAVKFWDPSSSTFDSACSTDDRTIQELVVWASAPDHSDILLNTVVRQPDACYVFSC